jgi:hypothetical protein
MNKQMRFNGPDYIPGRDDARLSTQYWDIYNLMQDGEFRSLRVISILTDHPEASVSAQLRHMRKTRFGSNTVTKTHIGGLYKYSLIINDQE